MKISFSLLRTLSSCSTPNFLGFGLAEVELCLAFHIYMYVTRVIIGLAQANSTVFTPNSLQLRYTEFPQFRIDGSRVILGFLKSSMLRNVCPAVSMNIQLRSECVKCGH